MLIYFFHLNQLIQKIQLFSIQTITDIFSANAETVMDFGKSDMTVFLP